jgi:aminoglycoside phosphotransferase (APT) family kinase protein
LPAPSDTEDWETRYNGKIDRKISQYQTCPIRISDDDKFLDFISQNRPLLKDRKQTYQHGDYHVGNLIITSGADIGVIDFNRSDFGDPWEDFNRIIFCSSVSPSFANGRIDGYFDSAVPEDFFRLLALYISVNAISAVPWAIPFGDNEIHTMLEQAEYILRFYDDFSTVVPKWYKNEELQKR